jgi:hypothetical protein
MDIDNFLPDLNVLFDNWGLLISDPGIVYQNIDTPKVWAVS